MKPPSLEKLFRLKNVNILETGNNLELDVRKSLQKAQLIRVIMEHTIDNNVFDEDMLNQAPVEIRDLSQAQLGLEKFRISTKAKREKATHKAEIEKVKIEQETQFQEIEEK